MKPPLFLAIDIGTSSVRSALFDYEAEILPETLIKNTREFVSTSDGGFEIEADEALLQTIDVIDQALEKLPDSLKSVEHVAASSFWHSLLGIDSTGDPTTKLFAWAETRPAKYVGKLKSDLDEKKIHNRTGCHFHSSYWPAKLLWLFKEHADAFRKTARWISFSDYVALKFFGDLKTSVSMASGTGILEIRKNKWDQELLDYLHITEENLPKIVEDAGQTFRLNEKYSQRWKPLTGSKWFLGIGDGAGNNVGVNCVEREKAALMIGTSGAMRVAFEGEVPDEIPTGLWCYRIDRKRVIIGGALSDGGGLYSWIKSRFCFEVDNKMIEAEIERRPPDSHGLTFMPFIAGERSTGYNDFAGGAILGLRPSTDPIDIMRAAFESVAYRFAEIFDRLSRVIEIKEIIASGGALQDSPAWTQIICDTLAQNMELSDTPEASLRGVVLLGLEAIGKIDDISKIAAPVGKRFQYSRGNHKTYRVARRRHEKFYSLLINFE